MIAELTRPVTFLLKTGPNNLVIGSRQLPAGAEVYTTFSARRGDVVARIPGTLYEARVDVDAVSCIAVWDKTTGRYVTIPID